MADDREAGVAMADDREAEMGRRRFARIVAVFVLAQALLAMAAALAKTRGGRDDVVLFQEYAERMMGGLVPYRDFRVEYPPLALPFLLAPRLVARSAPGYRLAFGVEMFSMSAATAWLIARRAARSGGPGRVRASLAWHTVYVALLARFLVARYDAAPAFFGFAAALWWFDGRPARGGAAAGLGTLIKIYPAVVAAVASVRDLARRGRDAGRARARGLAAFAATILLGAAAWAVVGGPRGVRESIAYHLDRGLEFGSVYSGAQLLAAWATGAPASVVRDHISWASITPWTPAIARMVLPLQAAALLATCCVFLARGAREEDRHETDGVRYSAAAVLAFVVMGKVFSPQFLIWLAPFFAVLEGPVARRGRWLFAAGCALALIAPGLTGRFPRTSLWVVLAYNLKNLVFLALLALLVFGPSARAQDRSSGSGPLHRR